MGRTKPRLFKFPVHIHTTQKGALYALASLTCFAGQANATGLEQAYQSAEATALGNAVIASVDDASAIHFNPAGLAKLENFQFQSNTLILTGSSRYRGPAGRFRNENITPIVGSLFLAGPVTDSLGIGLGITAPHGLKAEYAADNPLRSLGYDGELEHIRYSLGIGWKATPTLHLGATVYYAHDKFFNRQAIPLPPDGQNIGDSLTYRGTGDDWGWSAGLQWEVAPGHRLAATYRSGATISTSGTVVAAGPLADAFGLSGVRGASTSFPYPDQYLIGYAYENDKWVFEFNWQYNFWSRVRTITLTQDGPGPQLPPNVANWDDSQFYGIGVTYKMRKDLDLRFGYLYGTQAVPDRSSSPLLVDSGYHALSFGVGLDRGPWEFDATIVGSLREPQGISGNTPSPLDLTGATTNGKFRTKSLGFHFAVTRHF